MGYLTRYNPLRDMTRAMDIMADALGRDLMPFDDEFTAPLALDVSSDGKQVIVKTAVPGINEDDLKIEVTGDVLTISAESHSEHEEQDDERHWHMRELRYGKFSRSVRLPDEVNADKAQAELMDGVLTLTLPKVKPNPIKQIAVKARHVLDGKEK
ncbi:MAG: Hsp20/alpha crystallin family protein [Anaerolineae bacterium]|nr:Hsp20/alpha crystallin family protein [Anaerolineae bacterium]